MSNQLKAFVGHSFTDNDLEIVGKYLKFFDQIAKMNIGFSWEHAETAEPKELADKVKRLIADKNLFVGICTNKEAVIDPGKLRETFFDKNMLKAEKAAFSSKTSDWITQEIGLAIGRDMDLIILLEKGVQKPGGLQGNIEYITFDRGAPEKSFGKILEMIESLLPKARKVLAEQSDIRAVPEERTEAEESHPKDWLQPHADWDLIRYKFALYRTIATDDEERRKKIVESFHASPLGQVKENVELFESYEEYFRIKFAKGGKLTRLEALAKKCPENTDVQKYLAFGYQKFDDHHRAAVQFKFAAEKAKDKVDILSLYGKAAVSFAQGGQNQEMNIVIKKMKAHASEVENSENMLIQTLCEIAEIYKDKDLYFGVIEQLLQINPDDNLSRFHLAYKYSQINQDELALFHYLKIPFMERDASSWNNIGVEFEICEMPNKSVEAFRQSEKIGETLAMSNLANKLIKVGFLEEAEEICNRALKIENYHKNVIDSISKIKAMPEEEEKKENAIRERVRSLSEFYREYGHASLQKDTDNLAGHWQGPSCDLNVTINENRFTASGFYEQEQSLGIGMLMRPSAYTPKKKRLNVKYEGQVFGRAIKGTFMESADMEPTLVTGTSLLGDALAIAEAENKSDVLMILSDTLQEIRVYEKGAGKDLKYYIMKRVN